MQRAASDMAVVAAGIILPTVTAQVVAQTASKSPLVASTEVPQEHAMRNDQQWWLDAGTVTVAFTALAAGLGVIGKRMLELWKDYIELRDKHEATSLRARMEQLENRCMLLEQGIRLRDDTIVWNETIIVSQRETIRQDAERIRTLLGLDADQDEPTDGS